jgi:hypothetical protein
VDEYNKLKTKMNLTAEAGAASAQETSKQVSEHLKEARRVAENAGGTLPTTGLSGQVLQNIGGTAALDLYQKLEPVKANIAFARLQKMRELAPTGGALGQVAVEELRKLERSMGSLDQAQSHGQFIKALDEVERNFQAFMGLTVDSQHGSKGGRDTLGC